MFTGMATSREGANWSRRNLRSKGTKAGERHDGFKDGDAKIRVRVSPKGDHSEVHWTHKPTLAARARRAVGLKARAPNFARAAAGSLAAIERDTKRSGEKNYRVYGMHRGVLSRANARGGRAATAHDTIYRRMVSRHKIEGIDTDTSHPKHITLRVRKSLSDLDGAIAKARGLLRG